MKVLGLTGGVGMGKSTAAGFFLQAGARVVDTDEIAHQLVRPGQAALAEIKLQFGDSVISQGGTLNRSALAHIVFKDESALRKLEAILHPRIRQAWQEQVKKWGQEGCALAVVVIPLLYETQADGNFDKIICVACSPQSQFGRLQKRGWNADQIHHRIAAQLPVDQKMARAHHIIWTEGKTDAQGWQIAKIIEKCRQSPRD